MSAFMEIGETLFSTKTVEKLKNFPHGFPHPVENKKRILVPITEFSAHFVGDPPYFVEKRVGIVDKPGPLFHKALCGKCDR
ncbi:MAG: hypothetical protein IJV98_05260 [Clostridia bacterium]|nr:hypothetical protein [Clostridia bacterium]